MHVHGLHHVTAVTGNVSANKDFYTRVLGLRLVKKSVNQDDTSAYHLFYADKLATPGSDMTFFDSSHAREHGPYPRRNVPDREWQGHAGDQEFPLQRITDLLPEQSAGDGLDDSHQCVRGAGRGRCGLHAAHQGARFHVFEFVRRGVKPELAVVL